MVYMLLNFSFVARRDGRLPAEPFRGTPPGRVPPAALPGDFISFGLTQKKRSKEKVKAAPASLLLRLRSLKGLNSLRSNSKPFLTLSPSASLNAHPLRPGGSRSGLCYTNRKQTLLPPFHPPRPLCIAGGPLSSPPAKEG